MLVFLHLSRLEHGSGITQIPNAPKTFSFTLMNSCWLKSSPFPNKFKLITNSKNVLFVHKLLKTSCSFQKNAKGWFVVVDKRHAHPGNIKLHHNRPNSLANAAHAASEFRKQRLTFLSINIIIKYFALPCKVQKTTKNTSFPDVIPPFCSKSRAVHKEDIVVTKFHMPYQVVRGT